MFRHIKNWFSRNALGLTLFVLIAALVFAWLTPTIFVFIPPGHVGVYWVRFGKGTVTDRVLGEGVAYKVPWDLIYIYDARMQIVDGTFNVLASDGLQINVDMATRYRLIRADVPLLHKVIGPNYIKTLVLPEVGTHSRQVIARYTPEQLYSLKRTEIEATIVKNLRNAMHFEYEPEADRESFVHIENLLIKKIFLPELVREAIEEKQVQFHIMQGYDFRLEREKKETERKRIEAMGIRDFQNIVNEGISEQYLKWKGINATLALATSHNSKVVVIGAGEGGLPIILGNVDSSTTARGGGHEELGDEKPAGLLHGSELSPSYLSDPVLKSEDSTLATTDAPVLLPAELSEELRLDARSDSGP